MGVRSPEPEGSLVKICNKIAGTLLTLVITRHFFPLSVEASSNQRGGSVGWKGGRSRTTRKFFPSLFKLKPSAFVSASPDDIMGLSRKLP